MSWEAWGTPPDKQELPQLCPVCDGEWHAEDCELGREVARRLKAEDEVSKLRVAFNTVTLSQFLSDVTTAAGLLEHGKRDKGLAKRMADRAWELREKVLGPNDGAVPMGNLSLLEEFANRFLDPEDLGYSVNAYTRDQARVALGRQPVESSFPPQRKTTMTTPDQALETAIVAAGANVAPRITPAKIEANIAGESYFTAADGLRGASAGKPGESLLPEYATYEGSPLSLLTFCVLTLRNGFTVTGESACASPNNYNAEIGRRIARENAVAKIWPLMGYELRTRIATGHTTIADRSGN